MMQPAVISPMDSLREEHKAIAALLELMKQEQAQLIAANIEGLQELTDQKAKIITQMSEMAVQRHRALAIAGFAPKEEGMQAWIASINQTSVGEAWAQLLALTRTAKELNRVNGMLINKKLAHNQSALNALHAPAAGSNNFYGPNGQSTNHTSTRRLVVG
jgi:flagella synthesis protein FlgN